MTTMKETAQRLIEGVEMPDWCSMLRLVSAGEDGLTVGVLTKDSDECEIEVWRNETGWQAQATRDGWDSVEGTTFENSIGNGWGQTAEEAFAECLGSVMP